MNRCTFSFGASFKGSRKELKKFSELVYPRTRPKPVHTKKRVKWRLASKWFNRYEKQFLIGKNIMVDCSEPGNSFISEITDVKIKKAGGHRRTLIVKSRPITVIHKPKSEESCK